jgi:hypothetical protein
MASTQDSSSNYLVLWVILMLSTSLAQPKMACCINVMTLNP